MSPPWPSEEGPLVLSRPVNLADAYQQPFFRVPDLPHGETVSPELPERPDGSRLCIDLKPNERIFQPRFAAYARVHGRTPEAQIAHDKEAWPGGLMCGFVLWNTKRWREWRAANGYRHDDILPSDAQGRYDSWLAELPVVGS